MKNNEFVLFSDIHYYASPKHSYIRPDGMNSWLYEKLNVTKQIFDYAAEHNVKDVIGNGDLFEEKNRIDQNLYNTVWNTYREFSSDFDITLNVGNHDFMYNTENSSLAPFSDFCRVITERSDLWGVSDYYVRILPYGMIDGNLSVPKDKKKMNILLTHEDIAGLKYEGYTSNSMIKPVVFNAWDLVINGHIHTPQTLDNIINIGACIEHKWTNATQEKHFIHFKDGGVTFINLDTPKFYTINEFNDDVAQEIMENDRDFFRINVDVAGAKHPIFKKYNVRANITKSSKRVIRLKDTKTDTEDLIAYIKLKEHNLNNKKLLTVGKSLIEE